MTHEVKEGYFEHKINTKFTTKKMFYVVYTPLQKKKYEDLKNEIIAKGEDIDWSVGMIEEAKLIGNGWIGIASKEGSKEINQEFIAYKHVGEYKGLMNAYKKVMKDYPEAKQFYNLYMTDPNITEEKDNITYILIG